MSVNKIWINGFIGRDVEIRSLPTGGKVARFDVATNESWRDRESGEWKEQTEWHRVITYQEGLISVLEGCAVKGRMVNVLGKMTYRSFRKQGEESDRTVAEILVDIRGEIDFPTPKPEGAA